MAEWRLGPESSVEEGRVSLFMAGETEIGVLRLRGRLRAFENWCPHQGGPVCYGEVLGVQEAVLDENRHILCERFSDERFNLVCPWHGYSFDVESGENIGDRRLRLRRWDLDVRDGEMFARRTGG